MKSKSLLCFITSLACLWGTSSLAEDGQPAIPDGIVRYVERPEPDYRWERLRTHETPLGNAHLLELTSQKWQDIVWKHALVVYDPPQVEHPEHMLLFVTGGRIGRMPEEKDFAMGLWLANRCKARVATLHQVPNQPLMGDRYEDDLITETWLKYLETGDESWPLLFPMVKSAMKAMDALGEFAAKEWQADVQKYVITGASKRGWTSWLTPVVDKRVVATAPIVIDVLNFPKQMTYQKETWGTYSEQIADYTSKGLVRESGQPQTPREEHLWRMMDPYTYRHQLTLPKLLIVGTNDRYWVVDAMGQYWDDLVGPKFALQVPNAGHNLGDGREHAMTTLAAFFRHAATGTELPQIDWKVTNSNRQLTFNFHANSAPVKVTLWQATAEKRDFRDSTWTASDVPGNGTTRTARLPLPERGHLATFGELQFHGFGTPYSLTTLIFVH